MYGLSGVAFVHGGLVATVLGTKGMKATRPLFERTYDVPIPPEADLAKLGDRILLDTGLTGLHGTHRQSENQINVYVYTFLRSTQFKYFIKEKRLVAEERNFRLDNFLTGMHVRSGFRGGFLDDLWAVIVDIVAVGMLGWVASGLFMWWQLKSKRWLGLLALGSGLLTFIVIVFNL
jgi:hypothetical protein